MLMETSPQTAAPRDLLAAVTLVALQFKPSSACNGAEENLFWGGENPQRTMLCKIMKVQLAIILLESH